jgi:hypothetical protein
MLFKDLVLIPVVMMLIAGGIAVATLSQKMRDLFFFLLVTCAVITERMDVNFLSHYWYRGTTRGIEFSLIDVFAISILVSTWLVPRYGRGKNFWPASLGLMLLYTLYAGFSILMSDPKIFGVLELSKIIRGVIVFVAAAHFVRTRRELSILILALCCVAFAEAGFALKQRYLESTYRSPGTLSHPNSLSMYLCLIGPMLVAGANYASAKWLRVLCYLALLAASVAVLTTISRAGIPTFAFVTIGAALCCMSWRFTATKIAVTSAIILGTVIAGATAWNTLKARYESSSLEEEYIETKGEGRGVYLRWCLMMVDDHFYGVGLNNWSYWVTKEYGAHIGFDYEDYDAMGDAPERSTVPSYRHAAPAHSLAALTLGELGVPGFFVFSLVWMRWFQMGAVCLWRRIRGERYFGWGVGILFGTGGVFLQSITEWTYRQTAILFTFHIMLGVLASLYHFRDQSPEPVDEPVPEEIEAEPAPALVERW